MKEGWYIQRVTDGGRIYEKRRKVGKGKLEKKPRILERKAGFYVKKKIKKNCTELLSYGRN